MGRNGRKRGWCGGRRRDWKLRWQNRNIRVVESDDGEVEGDDEEVQGHLTFDPDTGLYTSGRGEQEEEEEEEAGGEQGRGVEDWRQGARGEQQTKGASSKSRRGEQEREAGEKSSSRSRSSSSGQSLSLTRIAT